MEALTEATKTLHIPIGIKMDLNTSTMAMVMVFTRTKKEKKIKLTTTKANLMKPFPNPKILRSQVRGNGHGFLSPIYHQKCYE